MKLSIIIPTFNEIKNDYIQKSFPLLHEIVQTEPNQIEVLIVDSHSQDGTIELAKKYNFKVITCETTSRAYRLKLGIENSQGEKILLHHPRSLLTKQGLIFLKEHAKGWGAFTHKFDSSHPLLSFTSFWSNYIRGTRGIFYLDHCIYFERKFKEATLELPDLDIFEDTEICKILRSLGAPELLPFPSTTSAIRFKKNGVLKQAIMNQKLKIQYYLGVHHQKMNRDYEKNLKLNSEYESSRN